MLVTWLGWNCRCSAGMQRGQRTHTVKLLSDKVTAEQKAFKAEWLVFVAVGVGGFGRDLQGLPSSWHCPKASALILNSLFAADLREDHPW